MKHIIPLAVMLMDITNFAADNQSSLLNYLSSIPSKAIRHYSLYNDPEAQKEILGLDQYNNQSEHQKTQKIATYMREISKTIPLTIAIDNEMISQHKNRFNVWHSVARRILSETGQNGIGDLESPYTVKRIQRLKELMDVFGTPVFGIMLTKTEIYIRNQLKPFMPTPIDVIKEQEQSTDNKTTTVTTPVQDTVIDSPSTNIIITTASTTTSPNTENKQPETNTAVINDASTIVDLKKNKNKKQ